MRDKRDIHGIIVRIPSTKLNTAVKTFGRVIAWFVWGKQKSGASHLDRH